MHYDTMPYDAIVVGGSYAGLSAALALGRAHKRVLVIDAGQRRNRFAHTAHGLLGQDGRTPDAIARDARAEVAAYPTIAFLDATAIAAAPTADGFLITTQDGASHQAARLVLATGVVDELPDLPGLRALWGTGVFHCPYCHGYEMAGQRLGVLAFTPHATHQANLIPEWGPTTFFTNAVITLDATERAAFEARGVTIETEPVAEVLSTGHEIAGVRLTDGRTVALDALFIGVATHQTSPLATHLGCAIDNTDLYSIIRVDGTGQTTVPGVFAAGDAAHAMSNLTGAVGSGFLAGVAVHRSLLHPAVVATA